MHKKYSLAIFGKFYSLLSFKFLLDKKVCDENFVKFILKERFSKLLKFLSLFGSIHNACETAALESSL